MNNPFTLSFGKKPLQYISRIAQTNEIIENFTAQEPPNQIYMLTGVRGSGKTVMMTGIADEIRKDESWIVVELNPTRDLLQSLAAKLYSLPEMHPYFVQAKLDFSALGLGVSLENAVPVVDMENAIERMLGEIQKRDKRLLITIDEVTNCEYIRIFASSFQIFLRQDYTIFLLMTGLYENIHDLQNENSLTFLYGAPKIVLEPLNYTAVRKKYMDIFGLDMEKAEEMTGLTGGYPFAFQVLGYLMWENKDVERIEEILPEYDQYLEEYVYGKIWSELSGLDRKILVEMAVNKETKVKKIRDGAGLKSEQFAVYRDRLKRKGILDTRKYGEVSFILPRFAEFVRMQML
ncbi:MAG: KAP family NTPase [Lachnospiraceae bacterium]|nr:KAP family NTPase [Lachnospiraceae bacterium]